MFDAGHEFATSSGVGDELVGDHAPGPASLFAQQATEQASCGRRVSMDLHDFVENIAVLIDGAPQIAPLTGNRNDDFIEMPDIVATGLLPFQASCVVLAEFHRPATNGLVGYDNPALDQHFLDQAQAEGKPEIEPDRMGDDLRRETMALVAHGRIDHGADISHARLPKR